MKKIFLIIFLFFSSACFTPDEIVLTDEEKHKQIETLAKERMEQAKLQIETYCDENFERLVARAVDSLVAVYLDSTESRK